MTKRNRGRPKGPTKIELRVRVTPEVADWLKSQGISKTVEAMSRQCMGRKPG